MAKQVRFHQPEDKLQMTRAIWLNIMALLMGVIALVFVIYTYTYTKYWTARRDNLVCVPTDSEYSTPLVYRQSALHPLQTDAIVKKFIVDYVSFSKDESLHKMRAVSNNSRYSESRISENKWKAVSLSVGEEQNLQKTAFYKSSDLVNILKKGKFGWSFLIDDLIVNTTPDGSYWVTVRGFYQASYDATKSSLPPQLDGYREIQYYVVTLAPQEDSSKNLINPHGLFVAKSFERIVPAMEIAMLQKRDSRYYLQKREE